MKWNRRTVTMVVIVMLTVAFTSFVIEFAIDHDGETITFGDDAAGTSEPASVAADGIETGDLDPQSGLRWVVATELPVEGQATLALIDQGGPFPYDDKDGGVFSNREGILPDRAGGYYREYTVLTPWLDRPRARRIVTGSEQEFFWTEDHYASFVRIAR